jgi:hypothetical protein
MMICRRKGGTDPCILKRSTRWRWMLNFTLRPGDKHPGNHSIGQWMGPRAGREERKKISALAGNRIPVLEVVTDLVMGLIY